VTADDGLLWRVSLLGPVRAWRGDAEAELGAPQRRAVLGLLAARANQVVSRDELIDGIWGEELPGSPVNALHVHVARLRMALEPDRARRAPSRVLLARQLGYLLRLAPGQLDAEVFAQTLAAARELREAGDLAGAAGSFNAALRLWQGDALAGIPGPWAEIVRAGLGEQRLTATEEHIETILALGRHAEAAPQLMELVRVHPLLERFSGQLMLALYRCGRQAAERHYRPHVPPVRTPAPPVDSPDEARGWLDAERATLVAMAVHAATQASPGHATRLAAILYRYLETGGHYADAVTVHGHARHAACLLGDRAAEATALTNLGIISWRQGRYRQAADYHQQALAASVEIADRMGEAVAVANLGAVYERQGRYERAAGCHQQALALFRETGDRSGEASALPGLGVAYQRQGRCEQAFGCYHQALALFRVSGDRTGEAEALNGLGEILLSTGRPDEARVEHAAALTLASQIGDRYEQARAHSGLGAVLGVVGDAGLAQQHRQRALDLYSELGAAEAVDARARLAAMDHGDPSDLAHGDLVGLLLPGNGQLAQQAFQRRDGPAELLCPAEPAELAGLR